MSIHEECGVFGLFAKEQSDLAKLAYYGLFALQHRGQESCGIVVNDDGLFYSHKDIGLVSDVFTPDVLSKIPYGTIAVGHVRYATTGEISRRNCQPIEVNHQNGKLAIAHNGNISNASFLREQLESKGAIFHSTSDTEIIAYLLTQKRMFSRSIEEAVISVMDELEGAYSLVIMSSQKLICVRDPRGFRPLCYGKTPDDMIVVASESVALKAVGAQFIRDIKPGEVVVFDKKKVSCFENHCEKVQKRICCFEYIYFARPDSIIDGQSVHKTRCKAGEILAQVHPVEADIVIGVPDSGIDAALGYSRMSKIPFTLGLIKNKYIGRTFINPSKSSRTKQVQIKLSAIDENIKGKRVIMVDDSIVRGTTSKAIVQLLKDAGAKEIHMRISSPAFLYPCFYGTDIDSNKDLIANKYTTEEIASWIGVDSLAYLPTTKLSEVVNDCDYCSACFDGKYPTKIENNNSKSKFEKKITDLNGM